MKRRISSNRQCLAIGLVTALVVFMGGTSASAAVAASPSPAWQIVQAAYPTYLEPGSEGEGAGPKYSVFISNVGGASALGVTVTDTLPPGLTVSSAAAPGIKVGSKKTPCAVVGQVVTCSSGEPITAGASLIVSVPLAVEEAAFPVVVSNSVAVDGGGAAATDQLETLVSSAEPPFAILRGHAFSSTVADESGEVPVAGAQPFVATFNIGVTKAKAGRTLQEPGRPTQGIRSVSTELPAGLSVDPRATMKRCTIEELTFIPSKEPTEWCPPESQVGRAYIANEDTLERASAPIYNMVPSHGSAAELGFQVASTVVIVRGGLSKGFRLTARSSELISKFNISELTVSLWGDPSDPRHDPMREGGSELKEGCLGPSAGCSVPPSPTRFLSMPTSCTEPLEFSATVNSWQNVTDTATAPLSDREFVPAPATGCNQLAFEPTISSQATTNGGETSSGLDFSIHQPQDESVGGRSTAALKDATVTLPDGMSLNPAAANGLDSCTEQQMGYAPEGGKIRFATSPQNCPDAAKVGTVEVTTPLLDEKLAGAVYVAKPFDNPFGSLLAIYIAVEDETTGIVAKLAGKVEPDQKTGQLTARFTENPQLPIEDIDLHFFKGVRGVLTTPLTCGTKTTTSTLTPWSTPEGIDAHPTGSFGTTAGCYGSEGAAPKDFSFTAGTETPLAGAYSPFVLRLSRKDGTQHITGVEATLPGGLLGKLAGVTYCPESGIDQARSREAPEKGKEEIASPSCPSSSEVGTVNVTAGSGISPIPVSGHAYMAGPYKGAPLSMVVIVPAVAGPFDLGTVVDRVALYVGEYDARIRAVADPLPTIREGIPLDARSIELKLDRPSFTLNPTSCEAMAIGGSASTQAGQSAALNNRFQVGECSRLGFKPQLKISLKGQTKRTGHPALKAVVTYPKKGAYANIARAQVNLPHSEFLDQGNIGKACTKVLLAQQACPAKSIYGKVKAWTPLLEKPLEGPVYLVGGYGYKLPALVAELNGQIRVLLVGKVDTGKNKGIRNTFEAVPDAPVERFVLEMKGGRKYGLLENSENICKKKQVAGVSFKAQNGKALQLSTRIANSCGKKGKKKHGKGKKHGSKH